MEFDSGRRVPRGAPAPASSGASVRGGAMHGIHPARPPLPRRMLALSPPLLPPVVIADAAAGAMLPRRLSEERLVVFSPASWANHTLRSTTG
jgi:hypothetical protein